MGLIEFLGHVPPSKVRFFPHGGMAVADFPKHGVPKIQLASPVTHQKVKEEISKSLEPTPEGRDLLKYPDIARMIGRSASVGSVHHLSLLAGAATQEALFTSLTNQGFEAALKTQRRLDALAAISIATAGFAAGRSAGVLAGATLAVAGASHSLARHILERPVSGKVSEMNNARSHNVGAMVMQDLYRALLPPAHSNQMPEG